MKKTLIALALTVAAGPAMAADKTETVQFRYDHARECGIDIGRDDPGEIWIGKAQGDSESTAVPITFVDNTKAPDKKVAVTAILKDHKVPSHLPSIPKAALYLEKPGDLIGATSKINKENFPDDGTKPHPIGDYSWNTPYLLQLHFKHFEKSQMKGNTSVTAEFAIKIDC